MPRNHQKILYLLIFGISLCLFQNFNFASQNSAEFGFTTHFFPGYSESKLTEAQLLSSVNDLATKNIRWIRLPVSLSIKEYISPTKIEFNLEALKPYINVYLAAKSKGLKVYLATVPCYDFISRGLHGASLSQAIGTQYDFLAKNFSEADVWQIFNEANIFHKDSYAFLCKDPTFSCDGTTPDLPNSYLEELNLEIASARMSIRQVNPSALITTNVAANIWGNDQQRIKLRNRIFRYFEYVNSVVDAYAIDYYPPSDQDFEFFKQDLQIFKNKYGNKLWIAETGVASANIGESYCFNKTAEGQKNYIFNLLTAISSVGIKYVFLYQYQDLDINGVSGCEVHFGLIDRNLFKKPSYGMIMNYLSLLRGFSVSDTPVLLQKKSQALRILVNSYLDAFGRFPNWDEVYKTTWIQDISNGMQATKVMSNHIEWLHNSGNIAEKKMVIRRSYIEVLGAEPSESEINSWLNGSWQTYRDLVKSHLLWLDSSPAGKSGVITRSYQRIFGRNPYPDELNSWMLGKTSTFEGYVEQHRLYLEQTKK